MSKPFVKVMNFIWIVAVAVYILSWFISSVSAIPVIVTACEIIIAVGFLVQSIISFSQRSLKVGIGLLLLGLLVAWKICLNFIL